MNKKYLLFIFLLICNISYAGTVQSFKDYSTGDTVTAENLNGNFNNIRNEMNGGLDNVNADIESGFRFFEVVGALPVAGTEGRVVYLTTNDTLYFDNGTDFIPVAVLANDQTFTGDNTFNGTTTITTADINGGNIDGTIIGANTPANGTFTNLTANTTF